MKILKNKQIDHIISEMHQRMQMKFEQRSFKNERYLLSNQIVSLLCLQPNLGPIQLVNLLKEKYGVEVSTDEVISTLRNDWLGNPEVRKPLFTWVNSIVADYAKALQGDKAAMEKFVATKSKAPQGTGLKRRCQERLVIIGIFTLLRDIDSFNDLDNLMLLGNIKARYCLYDAEDVTATEYGFACGRKKKAQRQNGLSYAELQSKLEQAEALIERTNAMLKELQDEFNEQIAESKVQELTDFFSRLNSDSYGRILDELFVLRKGINELRKAHYELPEAINGLMIMVIKLLQFVKDSHIDPMLKVGAVLQVKANEIEHCNYEGSPFTNAEDIKSVKVISPGWVYRDKNIQISRPQLKEEEQ